MMSIWSECKQNFGIAKCNYEQENKQHRLNLDVGDAVVILKETTHWYYGYKQRAKEQRGIFPKTYIHLCDYAIVSGEYRIKRTEIVEEITKVLLEWGVILKQYFLATHADFHEIRRKMNQLYHQRSLLISGNLPVDEMRKITLTATSLIDTGNSLLGLDMVVRDENGEILDANAICTTELYEHHLNAISRIIKANRPQSLTQSHTKPQNKYSHNILLHVITFVCKIHDDCDLLFTLFDGEKHKPISENYVLKWSRTGFARDTDQYDNNRVLFTDLSKSDLSTSKLYLVCYAVRIGAMELREDSKRGSMTGTMLTAASKKNSQLSISSNGSNGSGDYSMRRPFGVACVDLTPILNATENMKKDMDMPFLLCEKDSLDGTLRKLLTNKDMGKTDSKIAAHVEVLQGDMKQIKEYFPRLGHTNVPMARKMGFPEVILPGDVRNDLYLTLCGGEFTRLAKTTERNVEVTVTVCNELGEVKPGVICVGAGHPPIDEYKSVVHYHDDKPKWQETFKIEVPIEDFKSCHLKFMLKHRSKNEQKDKGEKPFSLCYIKLMQTDGTTITQGDHCLAVYKVDHKKFDKTMANSYMELPALFSEVRGTKLSTSGLSLLPKDHFKITINLCSTKLTQSVRLLGLLNWSAHKEMLGKSLSDLSTVPGEEVVKFLQDILDALFDILDQNDDPEKYDQMVFMSIIYLIETVSDLKYQHFLNVLDMYINKSFSATLAYKKLIKVLQQNITEAIEPREQAIDTVETDERIEVKHLYKTTRYLHYVMKFIIRSRILYTEIRGDADHLEFATSIQELFEMFINMIGCPTDLLKSEGALLKNLHIIATDLVQVFDPERLSILLVKILEKFPSQRLIQSRMVCIKDFVDSKLFQLQKCRAILLPVFCQHIKNRLENKEEGDTKSDIWQQEKNLSKAAKVLGQKKSQLHTRETTAKLKVTECVNIMSNMLKLLYRKDIGNTHNDINVMMMTLLQTVIKTSHALDRENQLVGNLVAIMLGILQRMDDRHYSFFVKDMRGDLQQFVIELLLVFQQLVSDKKPIFPTDWMDMIMHQNTVILGSLQQLTRVIIDHFFQPFEKQVWSNYFECSIAFLVQSPLQLNDFNDNKRQVVFTRYRDLRKDTAKEIRSMWFQLCEHKPKFVQQLVEPILEMSMIPEVELRTETIPIFFDMMQCEYNSSRHVMESYGDTKRNTSHCKANFNDFETEMIEKLDILIGAGKGDAEYKELFERIMLEKCQAHNTLSKEGTEFVRMVTRQMDRLLEYRCIIQDESKENRMACTFSLLQFYMEINRKEMYIRYVYKLCDLHMEFENYTEAAFTLKLHTELLQWNDIELSSLLKSRRHETCSTHRELKEALYKDIIDYFDRGKMWECAIDMCKVLAEQYENEIFDYMKLAHLYEKMSQFFRKILKELRHTSEYYRVAFYGLGFPRFMQNRAFIYRGKPLERLHDFRSRLLTQHPQAEALTSLEAPSDDLMQSDGQYIQVNSVEVIVDDVYVKFNDKIVANEIKKYFMCNNVSKFKYSRPYKDPVDGDDVSCLWLERTVLTTCYPLPGILRWFPVTSVEKFKISPLELAVETMKSVNDSLRDIIIEYKTDDTKPIPPLTMKITGIVNPAVMGGFPKYEEAFLTPEYLEQHAEDRILVEELKDLIASQMPLLDYAISVLRQKASEDIKGLVEHMETCFIDMRADVEAKYGRKSMDLKLDRELVIMRRNIRNHISPSIFDAINNRLSETSMGSSDSGLSKSTSSTRPPTIRSTFVSTFRGTSLVHSPSTKSKTKDKNRRSTKKQPCSRDALSLPVPVSNSQFYTTNLTPITATPERESNDSLISASNTSLSSMAAKTPDRITLTEELKHERPLRSEKEKERRLSRPASIATPTVTAKTFTANDALSLSGADSSNRNSIETTDSTSEDDNVPPPLPAKMRDSTDYSSLNFSNFEWNPNQFAMANETTITRTNGNNTTTTTTISSNYVEVRNISLISEDRRRPPTPPPKPLRNNKYIP